MARDVSFRYPVEMGTDGSCVCRVGMMGPKGMVYACAPRALSSAHAGSAARSATDAAAARVNPFAAAARRPAADPASSAEDEDARGTTVAARRTR